MHILDLIMYFAIAGFIWLFMHFVFDGEFTTEIGALVWYVVLIFYSIIYGIVFCLYPDLNWIDIFDGNYSLNLSVTW